MKVESSKPKRQRKVFYNMPLHKRQKSLASNLSKNLRKSLGKRAMPLRKEDKVKVMRGTHRGKEAKVSRSDYEKQQVFLEKVVRKKSDGTEIQIPFHASNLMIVDLNRSDARRVGKEAAKMGKAVKEPAGEKKERGIAQKQAKPVPKAKDVGKKEKKEKPTKAVQTKAGKPAGKKKPREKKNGEKRGKKRPKKA